MKSLNKKQKTAETRKSRFKIEKLEERIAPAKGGVPGPPDGSGGGGSGGCRGGKPHHGC